MTGVRLSNWAKSSRVPVRACVFVCVSVCVCGCVCVYA
jgi:hypothetical protein